jgi:hypothetical protein
MHTNVCTAGIEPTTSCVVGEYSYHYAKSAVNLYRQEEFDGFAEELDGPAVSALPRAIAEVKQLWSVIGWVTKNLLTRAPPCFWKAR